MKIHVLGTGLCYVGRILVQQQELLLHIEGILKTILLEGDDAQGEGEGDVVKTSANKRMHGSQGNSFIRLIRLIPLPSYLRLLVTAREFNKSNHCLVRIQKDAFPAAKDTPEALSSAVKSGEN